MSRNTTPPIPNNLLYSMVMENNNNVSNELEVSNLLKNKYSRAWLKDSQVNECMRCNIEFGTWVRKHHCRNCMRIYCNKCTPYRKKIPTTWNHENLNEAVRLCYLCSQQVEVLNNLDNMINIFSIIVPDMGMLSVMAKVSHLWNNLAYYMMGKLRNIQYRNIGEKWTILDRRLLWVNRLYFVGHSNWVLLLLLSIDYKSYYFRTEQYRELLIFLYDVFQKSDRKVSCLSMMCSGYCSTRMRGDQAIILLEYVSNNEVCEEINRVIYKIMGKLRVEEIINYLPFLIEKLVYQKVETSWNLGDVLIKYSMGDINFGTELYWNLRYKRASHHVYDYYLVKLQKTLTREIINSINMGDKFVKILRAIPNQTDIYDIKAYFRGCDISGMVIPLNVNLETIRFNVPEIKIKNSATQPLYIPIRCVDNVNKSEVDLKILYKFENVRQDYIIMKAIRLMKYILGVYEKIDIEIVDYEVLPIDEKSGLIEIVPNCLTVYEIKEKLKMTILNYIIEHNPNETIEIIRKRFIKSCATYCVITYLLGVGDRHLDNIMITEQGRLFHIDYGYVLGGDPKPISQPKMRITKDMIDALGGFNSIYYGEFMTLCNKIYQGLRYNLNLFISLMMVICEKDSERQRMINVLTARFMPSETHKTAIIQLQNEIHRSVQDNFSHNVIDFFHYHNKEKTVQQIAHTTQNATINVLSTSINYGAKVGGLVSSWFGAKKT